MRLVTRVKRIRLPRRVLFGMILLVWSLAFVVFTQYNQGGISGKKVLCVTT